MKECSKSIARRMSNPNFINKYFVGKGVDIGGLPDPLSIYQDMFCRMGPVKTWDWEDGDAQFMEGVDDGTYDFVHSSHCLEHLVDPTEGLKSWMRILAPGGHAVITVPDEDLYEQGVFPSTFNRDHKHTFTILKRESWSAKSINILDLIAQLGPHAELVRLEQLSSNYRFDLPRYDQSLTPVSECGIEFVIRKRPSSEIQRKGLRCNNTKQPSRELKIHLNQYANDMTQMKMSNNSKPPFTDDSDL